ncbi:hypothetical protein AAHC03_021155 [Spirometra sp. Aus1]
MSILVPKVESLEYRVGVFYDSTFNASKWNLRETLSMFSERITMKILSQFAMALNEPAFKLIFTLINVDVNIQLFEIPKDVHLVFSLTNYRRAVLISELAHRAGVCHIDLTHWPARRRQGDTEPRLLLSTIWTGIPLGLGAKFLEDILRTEDVRRGIELIADVPEQEFPATPIPGTRRASLTRIVIQRHQGDDKNSHARRLPSTNLTKLFLDWQPYPPKYVVLQTCGLESEEILREAFRQGLVSQKTYWILDRVGDVSIKAILDSLHRTHSPSPADPHLERREKRPNVGLITRLPILDYLICVGNPQDLEIMSVYADIFDCDTSRYPVSWGFCLLDLCEERE